MDSYKDLIIENIDQLVARFESLNPEEATEIPVEDYLLQRAVIEQARCEEEVRGAVRAARAKGISWQRVGEIVGTSAQAAHQRYSSPENGD